MTPHDLLKDRGIKATPQRIETLQALIRAKGPVGIPELARMIRSRMDTVTLYRVLEALRIAGLARRADLRHGHADYEFAAEEHHHHLVCEGCGAIEDVAWCPSPETKVKTKKFAKISDHALELFGTCTACA